MKKIDLYTDGACKGNPGPGGYGCVLLFQDEAGAVHKKELSGGFGSTTNNRMELLAAIRGLEALKEPCEVTLYSDSQYLINAYEKGWIYNWKKNRWFRDKKQKEPVKNKDLWQSLEKVSAPHKLHYVWVKGHADTEYNNRCDELAVAAAMDREHYLAETNQEEINQEETNQEEA